MTFIQLRAFSQPLCVSLLPKNSIFIAMRQFFKFFTASCLGTLVGLGLLFLIVFMIITAVIAGKERQPGIQANSVLELTFSDPMPEQTNNLSEMPFELSEKKFIGLHDYVQMIDHAAKDDKIKGILLRTDEMMVPYAEGEVLRRALDAFKSSGKFIYTYGKFMTQQGYYLGSVADSIWVNPLGIIEWRGISADVTYFKKLFDKLEIEVDVFYAGQFKSATEPFRASKMSDANRVQLREYIEDMFDEIMNGIASSRQMSKERLRSLAEDWTAFTVDSAVINGLVDGLLHEDQVQARLRDRLGLESSEEVPLVNPQQYFKAGIGKPDLKAKSKIAVVYMEGEINIGKEESGIIHDDHYVEVLREIEEDDKVKAVVLRVNSPGGSVIASENILRGIRNIKSKGKPVVVSMGRYAASGGYYISALADSIFAQPTTLTGSIGVFSLLPNLGKFLDNKLGITFDTVNTTKASTYFNGVHSLTEGEKRIMQKLTDDIYVDFKDLVAQGRNMSVEEVEAIAQGRIWTGRKAVTLGLADRIGYVQDAVASAATLAGIDSYRLDKYPKVKDPLQRILEKLTGEELTMKSAIKQELGAFYPYFDQIRSIRQMEGPQMRLPFFLGE